MSGMFEFDAAARIEIRKRNAGENAEAAPNIATFPQRPVRPARSQRVQGVVVTSPKQVRDLYPTTRVRTTPQQVVDLVLAYAKRRGDIPRIYPVSVTMPGHSRAPWLDTIDAMLMHCCIVLAVVWRVRGRDCFAQAEGLFASLLAKGTGRPVNAKHVHCFHANAERMGLLVRVPRRVYDDGKVPCVTAARISGRQRLGDAGRPPTLFRFGDGYEGLVCPREGDMNEYNLLLQTARDIENGAAGAAEIAAFARPPTFGGFAL